MCSAFQLRSFVADVVVCIIKLNGNFFIVEFGRRNISRAVSDIVLICLMLRLHQFEALAKCDGCVFLCSIQR